MIHASHKLLINTQYVTKKIPNISSAVTQAHKNYKWSNFDAFCD